jgi:hypothetical protein
MFVVLLAATVTLYGAEAMLVHRLSSRAPDLYKAVGSPHMFSRWSTFVTPLAKKILEGDAHDSRASTTNAFRVVKTGCWKQLPIPTRQNARE